MVPAGGEREEKIFYLIQELFPDIFEEIMDENFLSLRKETVIQVQEAQNTSEEYEPKEAPGTLYN